MSPLTNERRLCPWFLSIRRHPIFGSSLLGPISAIEKRIYIVPSCKMQADAVFETSLSVRHNTEHAGLAATV
jgi:hypothetical protein